MERKNPARKCGRWTGLVLGLAPLLGACGKGEPPPSVILISIDTLRADHVGAYGYARDTTPFLDRWSKDATLFERAFTTAAWTLVAHMTMLTGLFPEQHDVIGQERALSPEIPLLAERLHAAGYRTFGLYNPGWIHERHGFQRGFDEFRGHADLREADQHLHEVLAELDGTQPFFLFVHLFDVHCGPFAETGNSVYPAPEPYEHKFVDGLPPLPDRKPLDIWTSPGAVDAQQLQTVIAMYDGGIRQVDDQLALWFAELERRGLSQNSLMIVTADHGEALGQRGKLNRHGECWQEGLHVPLIVRHPGGLLAGARVSAPVHLGDIVPTVLATCGLPADARLPGVSLFGPIPEPRVIYGVKLPEAFVLRWPQKLVLGVKNTCQAMDLEHDPGELHPVPGDPKVFQQLRSEAMAPGGTFPPALKIQPLSAEEEAELQKLGYGGGDEKEPPKPADEKPK